MSRNEAAEDYWKCQYCGKHTSKHPKADLVGPDHWDCIINNIIDRKNEKQSRVNRPLRRRPRSRLLSMDINK